jgi:hypothetical protein
MDAKSLLLTTAFHHVIHEPNIEAAHTRFQAIAGEPLEYDAFRSAVDAALREHLIREPIRLPEGALQCHWHLELTPKGVEVARAALSRHGWA